MPPGRGDSASTKLPATLAAMAPTDRSPMVSNTWLAEHMDAPGVRVVQVDDDQLAFEIGHVPGARFVCWHSDLVSTLSRDLLGPAEVAALMDRLGIGLDTTVVLYGDQSNLWAAYAWWVLSYWGHPDLRLLDGGHAGWARAGLPLVGGPPSRGRLASPGVAPAGAAAADNAPAGAAVGGGYPVPTGHRPRTRARREAVERALATGEAAIVDVRSPAGYEGAVALGGLAPPLTGAIRGGHIPGALSLPWASLLDSETGLLLEAAELRRVTLEAGVPFDRPVIVYCELGASSGLTCLILGEILGHPAVANYDGSWLEWAATIGAPVALGLTAAAG